MMISAKRMAALREHVRAESAHDIDALAVARVRAGAATA